MYKGCSLVGFGEIECPLTLYFCHHSSWSFLHHPHSLCSLPHLSFYLIGPMIQQRMIDPMTQLCFIDPM